MAVRSAFQDVRWEDGTVHGLLTFRRELPPVDLFEAVDERGCIFAGDIDR
jgi:hypothetical protein